MKIKKTKQFNTVRSCNLQCV